MSLDNIITIGKANNGYITSKEIIEKGIPTVYLSRMLAAKTLNRLSYGIYILKGYPEDELYTLGLRYNRAVFARHTALYLNGMSNRQMERIEANFPSTYNTTKIRNLKCYHPNDQLYRLGMVTISTSMDHKVKTYNVERCICDLFYYDDFDVEDKVYAIKTVDKNKIDYDKLFYYAQKMNVLLQVKSVFEVI